MKEAALLFESGSYKLCNYSILVTSPEDLKIKRIIARDQVTEKEVRSRMSRQFTDEQKSAFADHTLVNDEENLLIPQILALHRHFLSLKA
jgi:dephospho-CoA kinase